MQKKVSQPIKVPKIIRKTKEMSNIKENTTENRTEESAFSAGKSPYRSLDRTRPKIGESLRHVRSSQELLNPRFRLRSVSLFERKYEPQIAELEEKEAEEKRLHKSTNAELMKKSSDEKNVNNFSQQNLPSSFLTFTMTKVYKRIAYYSIFLYFLSFATFLANYRVSEIEVDYGDCVDYRNGQECQTGSREPCICRIEFTNHSPIRKNVFVYYQIEGMFQNHMSFTEARDYIQLYGSTSDNLLGDTNQCGQLTMDKVRQAPYVPCGQLLNSMYNDTFRIEFAQTHKDINSTLTHEVPWDRNNLRLRSKRLSQNPKAADCNYTENPLKCAFRKGVPPPNWKREIWNMSVDEDNNGYLNDDLMNWITISTTSSVKKLWAKIVHKGETQFKDGLPSGKYILTIENNYPTRVFGAQKKILISNTSWLGGRNYFFSGTTFVLAVLCTLCTVYCFYLHKHYGKMTKRMHDYLMISERRDHRMRTSYILAHNLSKDISRKTK